MAEVKVAKSVTEVTLALTGDEASVLLKLLNIALMDDEVSSASVEFDLGSDIEIALENAGIEAAS